MHARITTIHSPAERAEEGIEAVRRMLLPRLREIAGFRGVIGLTDPGTNMGLWISLWEDADAMNASEDVAEGIREDVARAMHAETPPMVNRYDVKLFEMEGATA